MFKSFMTPFILFSVLTANAHSLKSFFSLKTDEQKVQYLEKKTHLIDKKSELDEFEQKRPDLMYQLKKVGEDQVDVWYDTILEGPYSLIGEPKVNIEGVYKKNNVIYAIYGQVKHPAVLTEDDACVYDEVKETFSECPELMIYQNFIMDINGQYIDSENYPETDF